MGIREMAPWLGIPTLEEHCDFVTPKLHSAQSFP